MGTYDVAQVCVNGHTITSRAAGKPELLSKACPECGAKTITTCPECNTRIRGEYDVEGIWILGSTFTVPKYCHNCGSPYPWTKSKLEAITMLLDEDENLDFGTKCRAIEVLPDLLAETPKTELAAARWKKLLSGTSKFVGDSIRSIFVEIGAEVALKLLGLK